MILRELKKLTEEKKESDESSSWREVGENVMIIIGLIWFILALINSCYTYWKAINVPEDTLLIHFPYYVWIINRAIYWLLFSLIGLFAVIATYIQKQIYKLKTDLP